MNQTDSATYDVQATETVTLEIEATQVGNFATFTLDGQTLRPVSTGPLTFKFQISAPSGGVQHGMIHGFFPPGTPAAANYTAFFTGSAGGGRLQGDSIAEGCTTCITGVEFNVI